MRIWTIQAPQAWEEARGRGYLTGSGKHLWPVRELEEEGPGRWTDQLFRAYHWMREQMKARIQGFSGDWPVWAFLERPDLRRFRFFWSPPGMDWVLIEAEVPESRALLHERACWDIVIMGGAVTLTEAEYEASKQWSQQEIEATWPRMFGPWPPEGADPEWVGKPLWEAVVDRVYLDEVRSVRAFRTASPPRRRRS